MSDYTRIYLQPECCADPDMGRLWCQDDEPETCPDGEKWTPYVLASELDQKQADLDRALARVCMQHDYLESLVSICTKQAKLLDSTVDPLVDLTNRFLRRGDIDSGPGKAWLRRKQAEVLERLMDGVGVHTHETVTGEGISTDEIWDYAQSLRQQADQLEKAGGEE